MVSIYDPYDFYSFYIPKSKLKLFLQSKFKTQNGRFQSIIRELVTLTRTSVILFLFKTCFIPRNIYGLV